MLPEQHELCVNQQLEFHWNGKQYDIIFDDESININVEHFCRELPRQDEPKIVLPELQ